jgi:2-oxoglutarate dehydrogenase complex dehydrogenase (E1) component-like enzyme
MLIRAYRMRGHLHANLDPLGIEAKKANEELDPASYGFTDADWTARSSSTMCSAWNSRPSAR